MPVDITRILRTALNGHQRTERARRTAGLVVTCSPLRGAMTAAAGSSTITATPRRLDSRANEPGASSARAHSR
jgi:hypothetical protein